MHEKKIYPKWRVVVRGARIYHQDEGQFTNYLVNFDGKEAELIIKNISKRRSRQEEKYYHAVVVRMVADAMEVEDQEAHEFLKSLFLRYEESKQVNGKTIRYERILSTTELDDKTYREYWGKCVHWAALPMSGAGLGISSGLELFIPMPNECSYDNY